MASDGQLREFADRGIVRLAGVFSDADAAAMREVVWQEWATRAGVDRGDPTTWPAADAHVPLPVSKRHPVFHEVLGPPLVDLADALLGHGWTVAKGFGNVLASFPDATEWRLPGRGALWHSDDAYTRSMSPLPSLRVFAVFGDTPHRAGGTLLVAGSHRMIERFARAQPTVAAEEMRTARAACNTSNGWLEDLTGGDPDDPTRVDRFMRTVTDVDGVPAQVVETSGRVGDVFVCHPWTIHCRPPNASAGPRFIRSPTLRRASV